MKNTEIVLHNQRRRITKSIRVLMQAVAELENIPEDEAAYTIMHEIGTLADAIGKASEAGSDDHGNDALDAYEAIANAIRAAKEAE